MTLFNQPAARALETLLDRERALIISGDIQKLARLLPEKERLLERVKTMGDSAGRLEHIQGKADRNQSLLDAVACGIKSVQSRLEAMREGQKVLRTYTQKGESQSISRKTTKFERRA
ncbi:flagellar biosynthesis protein FlgN [uncultured Aliiroseovarius sp.]|uniref:flagellar biosynthesis protein FlgN n=1 Tax=uncultured Aliiroseovarius sp. TaxID=1658783 RepID=UPI0026139B20|nr:flagellar biosynthesis protein FlgN [uncultured Aliiroseovarius sp.]